MFVFGSGVLIGTQVGVTPATPINFGLVQKVSLETSVAVKELYGQFAFPVAIGSGTRKVTCKATLARFSGQALGRLFHNQAPSAGSTVSEFAEVHAVPASGPFTVAVANSAHFVADQGVVAASTGLPLIAVSSSPAHGQYSVAAGVYTFAGADASANVLISYTYTASSIGQSLAIPNPLIGATANFTATLFASDPTNNLQFSVTLVQCVASKFSFDTSLEDFAKPDFEFQALANAAGQVMTFNFGEAEGSPAPPAPVNSVLPLISGSAIVGSTLTTTNGTWSGSPTGFTYQWLSGGSPISGATANAYVPVTGDIGAMISVTVTAMNGGGATPATSAEVGPVTSGGGGGPSLDFSDPANSQYLGTVL